MRATRWVGYSQLSVADPAGGPGTGTVTWNYSLANAATQYLAPATRVTDKFTVTIIDGRAALCRR